MLIVPTIPFRRRKRAKRTATPPPPPLALVSAVYDHDGAGGPTLTLTFNRPVNIDNYDGSQLTVEDQPNSDIYLGLNGISLLDPVTVEIILGEWETTSGSQVLLTATGTTGI